MQKNTHFTFLTNLLYAFLKLSLVILAFMSLVRAYMYIAYSNSFSYELKETFAAFWLGIRLDASVLAYINALAILLVFVIWLLNLKFLHKYLYAFFRVYFLFFFTILTIVTLMDLVYLSYFGEHATLMIFGVLDDDTQALINTAFTNYNVALFLFWLLVYFGFLAFVVFKIIKKQERFSPSWNIAKQLGFFLLLIVFTALLGRGSVGIFPLAYNIPDVSANPFINKLPQTSTYAILNSYEQYTKSKSDKYDLIKMAGYSGKIEKAFEIHKQTQNINRDIYVPVKTLTVP